MGRYIKKDQKHQIWVELTVNNAALYLPVLFIGLYFSCNISVKIGRNFSYNIVLYDLAKIVCIAFFCVYTYVLATEIYSFIRANVTSHVLELLNLIVKCL